MAGAEPASAADSILTVDEQDHLDLLNAYRADRGIPAIAVDPRAQADARAWARELAQRGTIGHDPGIQADCQAGGSPCTGWAENVGSAGSHQRVLELFEASPGHAENLRRVSSAAGDRYRIGIGIYRRGDTVWVVHRFYARPGSGDELAAALARSLTASRGFAAKVRADLVGSAGGASEIDAIAAPFVYGDSRAAGVRALATSDESLGELIDGFYRATLDRGADGAGREYWADRMRAGDTAAAVAAQFFASEEYLAIFHWSSEAWIEDLYQELIGRAPRTSERDYWLRQLASGATASSVSGSVYQSAEARQRRVVALYQQLLNRDPDRAGLDYWIGRLADGNDVDLLVRLASSDEYFTTP